jgi:hypothetical protein
MAIIEQQTMRDIVESKQADCANSDNIIGPRNSEIWNQVGMLEEEIVGIGNSIYALCENLEAAGVLKPDMQPEHEKHNPEEAELGEPPSCVRLGCSLQNMRRLLDRHNESVCRLMARLGV